MGFLSEDIGKIVSGPHRYSEFELSGVNGERSDRLLRAELCPILWACLEGKI